MTNPPVFSARKLNNTSTQHKVVKKDTSLLDNSSFTSPPPAAVSRSHRDDHEFLTKNDKYTVSKMKNFPAQLQDKQLSRGSVEDQFVVVINDNIIHVWNYLDSSSSTSPPITLSFPFESNPYGLKPFVVLIPNAEAVNDPGLVIVDSFSGQVKYYESINNAPLLKVLNFKVFELNLKLHNEFITLVEHIKDLGIFVATSSKKVVLITLKDNFNKPFLNKIDVISSSSSFKFISSMFQTSNKSYDLDEFNSRNNKILAIKEVSYSGQDEKKIVIQDSESNFEIWDFNKNSISNKVKLNLKNSLCSFLSDIYDNIQFSFKILDLVCLKDISSDVFLILTSFNKDESLQQEKNLVLFTVKITEDDILIYSTYKVTCYTAQLSDVPKLVLPKPYNTCFIIVNNSVILAEVITSLDPLKLAKMNYKTKWEDLISLRSDVEIVGYGYDEHKNETRNSGLLLATSNSGLLKIEKLELQQLQDEMDIDDELELNLKLQQEPMLFIKSHIEQAIYYGTNQSIDNPLLFQIPKNEEFSLKDIENAILGVLNELILNESKYLPRIYPSVEDFLKKRNQTISTLSQFIISHFKNLSIDLKILILNLLNKFKIALAFYSIIKNDERLINITKEIVPQDNNTIGSEDDLIRNFFFNHLTEISSVVVKFIKLNKDDSKNLELIGSIGESYLTLERSFRYDILELDVDYSESYTDNKPFLLENDELLLAMVDFYNSIYNNVETLTIQQREQVLIISEFFFYSFNDVLSYCQNSDNVTFANSLHTTYESNKFKWIKILTNLNKNEMVLKISEIFKDMTSILDILISTQQDDDSLLAYYFDKFGYEFATGYYGYLIEHNLYTKLFDTNTSQYLKRFFVEHKQFNNIYWIYQLHSNEYEQLSTTLLGLEDDLVTNKQLNLSLAKLSSIQNNNDSNQLLQKINFQLELCQYQLDIETSDLNSVTLIEKLKQKKILSIIELFDLLTLTKSALNYYRAYKIAIHLNDFEEYKLLFTRLLLSDDWDFLNDKNKTDEYLSSMIKSTITFNTIYLIIKNSKDNFELNVKSLLNKNIQQERLTSDELTNMDDELLELEHKYQLNDWIQSIISLSQD